jgi:hypothetical protein
MNPPRCGASTRSWGRQADRAAHRDGTRRTDLRPRRRKPVQWREVGQPNPVATKLVLMYLLIAESGLLGHLLLGHAGQQAQSFDLVAEEAVNIRTRGPAHVRHFPLRPRALSAAPMQVGARAGIGAFHALARARPRELFAGVPGKFGHIGRLTSAACSPRLNLAISRSIKRAESSR